MPGYIRRLCRRLKNTRPARRPKRPVQLSFDHLEDRRVPALIPVGPTTVLGNFQGYLQTQQAVAIDGSGRFAVVYTYDSFNGLGYGNVYTRLFAADGTPRTADIYVGSTGAAYSNPRLAMNHNGAFAITWTYTDSNNNGQIEVATFDANGVAGPTESLGATGANEQNPSIAYNDQDFPVVAYEYQVDYLHFVTATVI
jgi:hypothetical protein